jgi:uncharacterized protein YceK
MRAVIIGLALSISGCASVVSERLATTLTKAGPDVPVDCSAECAERWQRAQLWLVNHSKWKIQVGTDVVLQTFNPVGHDPSYGFTVTKEPRAGGGYRISMSLVCGNMLGCDPLPSDVRRAFYHYVTTGDDLLRGQGYLGAIR